MQKQKPSKYASYSMLGKGLAIYLDGCYWHGCPIHFPKANNWNKSKDRYINKGLFTKGYYVTRVWEHDINKEDFNIIKYINEILPVGEVKGVESKR
jgi:G:T-mismatch repair DNA endonuclease (very short patch repair protein)